MTDWTALTALGRSREIQIGVKWALLADPELAAFTGGRIHCIADPMAYPLNEQLPMILVSNASQGDEQVPNEELEVEARVAVQVVLEEDRDIVADTEPTVQSVFHRIDVVLFANPHLNVAHFGGIDLALMLLNVQDVFYNVIDIEQDRITQFPVREFTYSYQEGAATGLPS